MAFIAREDIELHTLISEYFREKGYVNTLDAFKQECLLRGIPTVEQQSHNNNNNSPNKLDRKLNVQSDLLVSFECGEREAFFSLWSQSIPVTIRDNDPLCTNLEFFLAVYFTLYPFRYDIGDSQVALKYFQSYLNSKGSLLATNPELTVYCALPYIPDPASHTSFQHLFTESWNKELRSRLEQFLDVSLVGGAITTQPRPPSLIDLYKVYTNGGITNDVLIKERLEELQSSYHTVAGIAIELVESLESALSGKQLSASYIEDMCARLFAVSSSPSQAPPPPVRPLTDRSNLRESVMSLRQSIQTPLIQQKYIPLDYVKLINDIQLISDSDKCAILQALRWRLTHSVIGPQRDGVIKEYIHNDLLQLNTNDNLHFTAVLLSSENEAVKECLCRLLNSLSSLRIGRDYLQCNIPFIQSLSLFLISLHDETPLLKNLLGAVQKLSLRRSLQSHMISIGLVKWILTLLSDIDKLSDYVLRYSLALLMNLCLRIEGKQECISLLPLPLNVLNELLEHESTEVRSYINGILYSLLEMNEIKQVAIDMDMVDILNSAMRMSPPELQSQLQFILNRLQDVSNGDSRHVEEENEEDEEDDPEVIDGDEDELTIGAAVSTGEEILKNYYKNIVNTSLIIMPISRPVTPLTRTQHYITTSTPRPNTANIIEQSHEVPLPLTRPTTSTS